MEEIIVKAEHITGNIWSFPIVLPENPLKWLNCYVIKADKPGGRNLLIDSGFRRPECLNALKEGMALLELKPEETDVFFTHVHADHCGNAAELQEMGCRIFMSEPDYKVHLSGTLDRDDANARMLKEGMDPALLEVVLAHNPAVQYAPGEFTAEPMHEGDIMHYGGYDLECIFVPGHTPGQFVLYIRDKKIMFCGDHVLFDITPNITVWSSLPDPLGTYLKSLDKIARYEVDLPLPAHRHLGEVTMHQRIEHLKQHHAARLAETERIIKENPGSQAFKIASMMKWNIKVDNWEDFPPGQKWFAVGEAFTHLDYLLNEGRIERYQDENGDYYYR